MFVTIYQILGLTLTLLLLLAAILIYVLRRMDAMENRYNQKYQDSNDKYASRYERTSIEFNLKLEKMNDMLGLQLKIISDHLNDIKVTSSKYDQIVIGHEGRLARIETLINQKSV